MNEKCKYCKYLNKCFDKVEYNSFYCLAHRVFPKIVEKSYDELKKENQELKKQLEQRDNIINKAKTKIKGIAYGGNEDYYIEKIKNILEILNIDKGE